MDDNIIRFTPPHDETALAWFAADAKMNNSQGVILSFKREPVEKPCDCGD